MGTEAAGTSADAPDPRASALRAVGLVTVVAVVAAGAVAVWVRVASRTDPVTAQEEAHPVPATTADGRTLPPVPTALSSAEAPVVLAEEAVDGREHVDGCAREGPWEDDPELVQALVTPDAMLVAVRGTSTEWLGDQDAPVETELHGVCRLTWSGGAWRQGGTGLAGPGFGGAPETMWVGDADGERLVAVVTPPEGTAWVVQDRGSHRLAAPVAPTGVALVEWSFDPRGGGGATLVTFHDEDGVVLGEQVVRG